MLSLSVESGPSGFSVPTLAMASSLALAVLLVSAAAAAAAVAAAANTVDYDYDYEPDPGHDHDYDYDYDHDYDYDYDYSPGIDIPPELMDVRIVCDCGGGCCYRRVYTNQIVPAAFRRSRQWYDDDFASSFFPSLPFPFGGKKKE